MNPKINHLTITSPKICRQLTFAIVSDLHNHPCPAAAKEAMFSADALLIPGDLVERHTPDTSNALAFLTEAAGRMPVFYSIGNHEAKIEGAQEYLQKATGTGAVILDNTFTVFSGVTIGGISSRRRMPPDMDTFTANLPEENGSFTLLLCHQPEYFPRYLQNMPLDLTISGHAHGGQIQLFGRGVYAPGQGFFPTLTHGFYFGNRLLVSRGMTNTVPVPRFGNPTEMIMLTLAPEK